MNNININIPRQEAAEIPSRNNSLTTRLELALGMERRRSEIRQLGALLVILGIGAAHSALHLTAILIEGMSGGKQLQGFRLPALCATTLQTGLGMTAIAIGFYVFLNSPTSKRSHNVAKILVFVVNLGPISVFITIARLIQGANQPPEDNEFIPPDMNPTHRDIRFVIAMGVLSLVSVCGTLIGGLTVVALNLCAFLGEKPLDKHRGYYVVRFAYYSLLVFIGGISQLVLGLYLGSHFGWGPYNDAVHVAVYTVFFPSLTALVGAVQTLYAIFGWCRALDMIPIRSKDDSSFAIATLICWVITMVVQVCTTSFYITFYSTITTTTPDSHYYSSRRSYFSHPMAKANLSLPKALPMPQYI